MVEVEVGHDHEIDLFGIHVDLLKSIDHGSVLELVDRSLLVGPLVTAAGLDQNGLHPVAQQKTVGLEVDAIGIIGIRPSRPHRLGDDPEHAAPVETEAASLQDIPRPVLHRRIVPRSGDGWSRSGRG